MRPKDIDYRVAPDRFHDDARADTGPIVCIVVKVVALIFARTKVDYLRVEVAIEIDERLGNDCNPHLLGVSTH
jgi:hypothetical protein